MKTLKQITFFMAASAIIFLGCGSDSGSGSHTQLINSFGDELREILPEVTPVAKKGSPSDAQREDYADAQTYGGLFQRVFGDDPLSIFFTVDMVDQLAGELLYEGNPDFIPGGSRELTLPFFGDTIMFPDTFSLAGTHSITFTLTYEDQSESMTAIIDRLCGGYSDDTVAISYHINIPDFADATTIYFVEANPEGKLYIRYATCGTEIHEGTSPYSTSNRRNVYFLRNIENDPYKYKSAGKSIRTENGETSVFSIISGGMIDGFLIRRRAYNNVTNMFIDQLFATTYDLSTHHVATAPLEEQYSTTAFDIDGEGFTGPGGLGDEIMLMDDDAKYLQPYAERIAAHEMLDFSEPDDLPQSENEVTPVGW